MTLLVYVQGLRGPRPEIWPQVLTDMSGKERPRLHKVEITDAESKLPLTELERMYPCPVREVSGA